MKNKIVIIGANSFIARNFISFLMNKTSVNFNMSLYDYQPSQTDGFKSYKQINILDKNSVNKIDFDADLLFIFLGKTGTFDGFENFEDFVTVNELGLLNVLRACKNNNFKGKIIFPSTRLVYKGKEEPLSEEDEKEFKTIYAVNKFACETYLRQFHDVFGLNYCILRICVPYGTIIKANPSYGTIGFMLNKAKNKEDITLYGDGSVKRTFTHMFDLCSLIYESSMNDKCINGVYNIGGEAKSLFDIASIVSKKYKVGIKFIPYPKEQEIIESGSTVFCDDKLQRILNYKFENFVSKWAMDQ